MNRRTDRCDIPECKCKAIYSYNLFGRLIRVCAWCHFSAKAQIVDAMAMGGLR